MAITSKKSVLTHALALGAIQLNVKNFDKMLQFYTDILGLDVIDQAENKVVLGKKNLPIVTLHHAPELLESRVEHAGLYHFAILFSHRAELAKTVHHILETAGHHFSGSADHLVSEAFYFSDPEGNGIELYYDREKSGWNWQNGQVEMKSIYIDPLAYIQKYEGSDQDEPEVKMGHFHLKVGDIQTAKEFYVDILGFDITAQLPGALFISVGGYHHHLGLNTWESRGAEARPESIGLRSLQLFLSTQDDFAQLKKRLHVHNVSFEETENNLIFQDPWQNTILVGLV